MTARSHPSLDRSPSPEAGTSGFQPARRSPRVRRARAERRRTRRSALSGRGSNAVNARRSPASREHEAPGTKIKSAMSSYSWCRTIHSEDANARHNGTAPLPVWSVNYVRHRLSRMDNRQINAALQRIAVTQAQYHPAAPEYLNRRRAAANSTREASAVSSAAYPMWSTGSHPAASPPMRPGTGGAPHPRLRSQRHRHPRRRSGRGHRRGHRPHLRATSTSEFLKFLQLVAKRYPRGQVHMVLDNYRTHKLPVVQGRRPGTRETISR